MNKKDVLAFLNTQDFHPKKRFGQNFLIDKNIRDRIINLAEIKPNDVILEVGPGLGALTDVLVHEAKRVIGVEIEKEFCLFLSKKYSNVDNFKIVHGDILTIELPPHDKIISNVPYSITGPFLEKCFFRANPVPGVITIERALANRLILSGEYKRTSRIGILHNSFMNICEKIDISRNSFYPVPKIPLSIIKTAPKPSMYPFLLKKSTRIFYLKFISGLFPYKNKDLVNALQLCLKNRFDKNLDKKMVIEILERNHFQNFKVVTFSIDQFLQLSQVFYELLKLNG